MVLGRTFRTLIVTVLLMASGAPYAVALGVPGPGVCRELSRASGPARRVRLLCAGRWSTYGAVNVDSLGIDGVPIAPIRGAVRDELLEKNQERISWADIDSLQVPRPQGFPLAATIGFVIGAGIVVFDPQGSGTINSQNVGPALAAGFSFGLLSAIIGRAFRFGRSDWAGVSLR